VVEVAKDILVAVAVAVLVGKTISRLLLDKVTQ
jgi:hypothetical protein